MSDTTSHPQSLRKILLCCLIMIVALPVQATYQLGDLILIDGEWYQIRAGVSAANLFAPDSIKPENEDEEHIQRWEEWEAFRERYASWNSGNWNGFVGLWKIADSKLILIDLVYGNEAFKKLDPERNYSTRNRPNLPVYLITGDTKLPHHFQEVNTTLRITIDGWHPRPEHWPEFGPSLFEHSIYMKVENGVVVKEITVNEVELPQWHYPSFEQTWGLQNAYFHFDPFQGPKNDDSGDWIDLRTIQHKKVMEIDDFPKPMVTRGMLKKDNSGRFVMWLPSALFDSEDFQILLSRVPTEVLSEFEEQSNITRESYLKLSRSFDPFDLNVPNAYIPIEAEGLLILDDDIEYIRVQNARVLKEDESMFKYSFRLPSIRWRKSGWSF
ncbi:MAG: hypothetical protein JJU05_05690 [Verrucomicrobia bacterium]|nr:hypothetical protein [Verrucomicrobiota bacterium]MCH8525631.1 hypothetical protein [Kiritimatiellia bacterium]